MIGIIDYGMANLRSVEKAFELLDAPVHIISTPTDVLNSSKIILPGVGAFADAMKNLRDRDLIPAIRAFIKTDRPFLGICLGLQLLFDVSEEDGEWPGLGILPGRVLRFTCDEQLSLKVPHMGWNAISLQQPDNPLYRDTQPNAHVYFVHSYYAAPDDPADVATTTDYGSPFCSSIRRRNVFATQFHPEKSQTVGLNILKNFANL